MKKKAFPAKPASPKSNSPKAIEAYEKRVKAYRERCAKIKKHNDEVDRLRARKEKAMKNAQSISEGRGLGSSSKKRSTTRKASPKKKTAGRKRTVRSKTSNRKRKR